MQHYNPKWLNKDDKKKITALNKDKAALQARLARTDALLAAIGGQLTEEEARRLILKKLYDLVCNDLNRDLNAEKRGLFAVVENLRDKYAVSSRELESERTETLNTLDGFLKKWGIWKPRHHKASTKTAIPASFRWRGALVSIPCLTSRNVVSKITQRIE
jgi:hypothetical protein